mmetsp:Transcript_42156/g.68283  ORF Transcript_42156/g.68283 Transcript_42156/m.68283 type:complete len:263 (-) Transcript_42156:161-949(-)
MGGEDSYDFLVPFDTIVKKGVLVKDIEDRKQALVEQCRSCTGLTLQEVIEHNDWLLQVERDLSKARSRIERDFRISYALSLKVREGKRKAQLQQRLDVLRAQCDVLNECIHNLSDHCSWFQESGTYREAVDYLDSRWGDEDEGLGIFGERLDLWHSTGLEARCEALGEAKIKPPAQEGVHHELDGLIFSDSCGPSLEKKRRKKKKRKGAGPGLEDGGGEGASEDDEDGLWPGSETNPLAPDISWLRAQGCQGRNYVAVWAPD